MGLFSGTKLGPYEIQSPLGAGGMGEVYRARDTRLERTVAIKVLPARLADRPELRQRLEREARTISQLSNSYICTLFDVGRQDETDYLVMEYVEGETLERRLEKGPLPPEQVFRFGVQIAEALSAAHRKGIVHRDLKPSNIMVNARHDLVIMDFGVAWRIGSNDERLTKTGFFLGTPAYMSPEQVAGDRELIGPASDTYSLGVILYELLTGRLPFQGSMTSVLVQITTEPPQPPSAQRPDLDPRLEVICLKALAKKPAERYASALGEMKSVALVEWPIFSSAAGIRSAS